MYNQSIRISALNKAYCWKATQRKIRSMHCLQWSSPLSSVYYTYTINDKAPPIWTLPSDMYILKKETSNVCCHRHTNTSNVGLLTLNSTDREEGGSPILTLTKIFEKGLTNQKTKDMKGQKLKRLAFFASKRKTKTIRKRPQRRGFPAEAVSPCQTRSVSLSKQSH